MRHRFVIVVGDKGLRGHNAGSLFQAAAETHQDEVKRHAFPGVPDPKNSSTELYHISSVSDLIKDIAAGNITYLAYFGHSWNTGLLIGEGDSPDTNLSGTNGFRNARPVSVLPMGRFEPHAQIRLFGCKAGFGKGSIASYLHQYLGVRVLAYQNSGGSLFTQDKALGHGRRSVTQADIDKKLKPGLPTWLVPINGTPTFREF